MAMNSCGVMGATAGGGRQPAEVPGEKGREKWGVACGESRANGKSGRIYAFCVVGKVTPGAIGAS